MNRWAARYGYEHTPKAIMDKAKKGNNGRYAAVNLWPWLEELYGPVPNASNHLSYKERSKIYEAAGQSTIKQ